VVADLRQQLYRHLVTFSLRFFADRRTGEIVSRVTNDVTTLQAAVTDSLVTLLQQSLTLVGGVIFLFWLDWRLTSVILLGIPIVTLTMVYLGRKIRRAAREVQDRLAEATAVVDESIGGIRIVKSFARETYEVARFTAKVEETFVAAMQRVKIAAVLGPTIGFMAFMSITITLWFGGYEVIQGYLSPGGLVAFLIYSLLVAGPIAASPAFIVNFRRPWAQQNVSLNSWIYNPTSPIHPMLTHCPPSWARLDLKMSVSSMIPACPCCIMSRWMSSRAR
jgi:subfamily B ATP-binding cassette protein MsbA